MSDEVEILCCNWPNGQPRYEHPHKNGEPHGTCRGWHENGLPKYEHPYKDGKRHGTRRGWNEDGQQIYAYRYEHGELVKDLAKEKEHE